MDKNEQTGSMESTGFGKLYPVSLLPRLKLVMDLVRGIVIIGI
jgi:hypothetical protein